MRQRIPTVRTNGHIPNGTNGRAYNPPPPPGPRRVEPSINDNPPPPPQVIDVYERLQRDDPAFGIISNGGGHRYHPSFARMVFQLRLLGANNRRIAEAFNVTENTIAAWRRDKPEFGEAYDRGDEWADAKVVEATFHRAIGYSHKETKFFNTQNGIVAIDTVKHYPPDNDAAKFWLTNRQRTTWKSVNSTELIDEHGNTIVPPQLVVMPVRPKQDTDQ